MSTMDVATLVTTLQNAIGKDQSLSFTGDLVGASDLDPLLQAYFPDGTVVVAGASAQPSKDGASAVVGGTVTYNAAACGATLLLTPGETELALALTLTPPAGWTLSQPFPGVLDPTLSGLSFAAGGVVICSGTYTEPSQNLTLARGMTVVAMLDLAASYPLLIPMLGAAPVAVHGVVTDPVLPQLVLTSAPIPGALGDVALTEVVLCFTLGNLAAADAPPISSASAVVQADLALSSSIGGTVTAVLPTTGSLVALDVAFTGVNLNDLSLLAPYLGAVDPLESLPSEVQTALHDAASAFQLSSLALLFDVTATTFRSVGIVVTVDLKGYVPFSALASLKIDALVITWNVDVTTTPAATTFAAVADIELTNCPIELGFQSEPDGDYLIYLRQNTDGVLKLSDLVTLFLSDLTMPELDVSGLSITLAPRDELYTFSATVAGSWTVLQDIGIELATVQVEATYAGQVTPPMSGSIVGVLEFEVDAGASAAAAAAAVSDDPGVDPPPRVIDLTLSANRPAGVDGWLLIGQTGTDQIVPIGDLITAVTRKFSTTASVPASLAGLTIENLSVQFDTVKENFTFGCQVNFDIDGDPVEILVALSVTKTGTGYDVSFGGSVLVGPLEFDLYFDESGTSTSLVAVYTHRPGDPEQMALRDLVSAISPSVGAEVPADIEIGLNGVKLVFLQQNNATEFAFSLDLSLSFGLSDLPLVGPVLPATSVSIEHLQIMYSKTQLTAAEAADVNSRLPSTVAPLPSAGLAPGVGVTASVLLDGSPTAVAFGVPATGGTSAMLTGAGSIPATLALAAGTELVLSTVTTTATAPASQPTAHWFDIGKSFGPVSIGRLGLQYQDNALFFLLDASMSLAALTLGLDGLGLGSPLTRFAPQPHLDGLSIAFTDGPVSIAGGFLAVAAPPPNVTDEYLGELTIAIEPYLISGVGAYAKVNGSPSFFVFAEVDGEFGGPPAFFVTGLMGGVGYNWALTIPPADQVYTFPFIAGLGNPTFFGNANPTPIQVLDALSGQGGKPAWVSPSQGQNWLAAGIQFSSFELILGRVLLVAEFGSDFELALLGLATIALPQGATDDAYAYAELQLEVVLKPSDGVFSAIASLTPNSYLLTKQCQLTGGFAFCLWFGNNPHAGDFVLSIGGYHPAFVPPAWYPAVPQLGFHWAVDDDIVIKGGAYFAITPTAAMAGGNLEVLFESGDLKAWLTAYANIMIRWRPFYLTADIGISVGVSYKLNLLFTSVTLSVELGATLGLWGPPTGGVVHVDWYIISFSIAFGAAPASTGDLTLDWSGFEALLPSSSGSANAVVAGALGASAAAQAPPAVLSLSVSRGLRSTDSASGDWIVRADELVLNSTSAIPMTSITFGTAVTLPDGAPTTIDIRPMGASNVTAAAEVTVSGVDLAHWPAPSVQLSALPEALWGTPIDNSAAPAPAANLIPKLATGLVFAPPPATAGSSVGPVDPDSLITPLGQANLPLTPSSQADPIAEPVADSGSILLIGADVASAASVLAQQALVTVLTGYGAAPPTSAALTELGKQAGAVFSQPPMRAA